MADTSKQVTIHKKYMISGGIGPIFGGRVTLTRLCHRSRPLAALDLLVEAEGLDAVRQVLALLEAAS